jgi:hypothetical protein
MRRSNRWDSPLFAWTFVGASGTTNRGKSTDCVKGRASPVGPDNNQPMAALSC